MRGLLQSLGGYQSWSDVWVRSGWRVQEKYGIGEVRVLDARNRMVFEGSRDECISYASGEAPPIPPGPVVILLHGLGCGRLVMTRMERRFRARGFVTANVGYPSLRGDVAHHAAAVSSVAAGLAASGATEVHFVVHSLGGLVALAVLARPEGWKPGRSVFIGSPVQGAALAQALDRVRLYRKLTGPCGLAVLPRTSEDAMMAPKADIGVIAGGNGGRGYNRLLDGDNDGTVGVEETRLPGVEADFLLMSAMHSTMPLRSAVVDACVSFLLSGRFKSVVRNPGSLHEQALGERHA